MVASTLQLLDMKLKLDSWLSTAFSAWARVLPSATLHKKRNMQPELASRGIKKFLGLAFQTSVLPKRPRPPRSGPSVLLAPAQRCKGRRIRPIARRQPVQRYKRPLPKLVPAVICISPSLPGHL